MIVLECLVCKQIKFNSRNLCLFCNKKINRNLKIKAKQVFGVNHYYLFEWNDKNENFIKPLIYSLKGKNEKWFVEWATFFLKAPLKSNDSFIVPGASKNRAFNHARSFAFCIAQLFSLSGVSLLEAPRSLRGPQKRLNREERIGPRVGQTGFLEANKPWIFVDDILVSGGTLKSLIEIYGLPKLVLTLIYKPLFGEENDDEASFFDDHTYDF